MTVRELLVSLSLGMLGVPETWNCVVPDGVRGFRAKEVGCLGLRGSGRGPDDLGLAGWSATGWDQTLPFFWSPASMFC